MKTALVRCPWWVRYCPPYILAFFATLLRKKGHEIHCFDLNNSMYYESAPEYRKYWDSRDYYSFWENPAFVQKFLSENIFKKIVDRIFETGAKVICFTTHTPNVLISLELAKKIKQKDKEKIVIFLGHKCSRAQMAFDFIKEPHVDYVCTGEADIALCELLEKLDKQARRVELPECRGFLLKRNGKIIDCGNPQIVEDMDSLPFPEYNDFLEDKEMPYSQPGRLDILDSRGCVNACHFCYERLYWQNYRTMSGSKIYEQICCHREKYPWIDYFYFNGLLLNGNQNTLKDFCDLVIENKLNIRWAGQAMVRQDMSGDFLGKMKSAGCEWLYYGIESGSQKVLNKMNRKYKVEDAVRVLGDTHRSGIKVQINVMFGFPTETEEDFKDTLNFLNQVRPYIDSVLASQSFCTLEKETYMRRHPEEFGITGDVHHLYWKSMDGKNNYQERFKRYEEFCRIALSLGLPETSGVLSKKPDKWVLLGDYWFHEKDYKKAAECYEKSINEEEKNKLIYMKLARSYEKINEPEK